MKQTLLLLFLFIVLTTSAQVGIKLLQFRPSGEMGTAMKNAFTGEILRIKDFNYKWRSRIGFSYVMLKPKLDTFITYTVVSSGSTGTTVYPAYQIFHKYNLMFFSFGFDYNILKSKSLALYPGLDILIGSLTMAYDAYGYNEESYSGGDMLGGLRFRIGTDFKLNQTIALFLEISHSIYLVATEGGYSHNDIGAGIRFNFTKK